MEKINGIKQKSNVNKKISYLFVIQIIVNIVLFLHKINIHQINNNQFCYSELNHTCPFNKNIWLDRRITPLNYLGFNENMIRIQ